MNRLTWLRGAVALLALAVVSATGARPVAAHTDFESSTPSNGSVVAEPVTTVTVAFTNPARPFGEGFIALTPAGVTQLPVEVQTLDDKLFTLVFDPPLAGGQIGIRWNVQAGDAHPIDGAFAFTVDTPAVTTTAAPATTSTVVTTSGPTTVASAATSTVAPQVSTLGGAASDDEPTEAAAANEASESLGDGGGAAPEGTSAQSLDEFLAADTSRPGETTATLGRVLSLLGVTLGLGGLGFLAMVLRGRRGEVDRAIAAVRLLGGLVAVGALVEYVGIASIGGESLGGAWATAPGTATLLRLLGGAGLLVGLAANTAGTDASRPRTLSAAVIGDHTGGVDRPTPDETNLQWVPTAASWPAFVGAGLIVISFWFDGHTVSKGWRPLHAVVNSVHLVAGSIWVGGVAAMATLAWSRARAGRPAGVTLMVLRFSKIATIALAAVAVTGPLMAVFVLDSFGELTATPWGKILLLKTAAVGLAIVGGAYNHFRLVPALEAEPDAADVHAELRSTLTAEAILLGFVVIVTAWLVVAAT